MGKTKTKPAHKSIKSKESSSEESDSSSSSQSDTDCKFLNSVIYTPISFELAAEREQRAGIGAKPKPDAKTSSRKKTSPPLKSKSGPSTDVSDSDNDGSCELFRIIRQIMDLPYISSFLSQQFRRVG